MSNNLSTPGANAVLDGTAMPTTLYVQLHTGNPGTNGTANVAAETRRKSFTRTAGSGGASANDILIEWLDAAATEDLTHVSLWSASSAGVCWWVGAITGAPIHVLAHNTIQIDIATLTLTLTVWS